MDFSKIIVAHQAPIHDTAKTIIKSFMGYIRFDPLLLTNRRDIDMLHYHRSQSPVAQTPPEIDASYPHDISKWKKAVKKKKKEGDGNFFSKAVADLQLY